jgi:hypothetical protein
MTLYVMTALTTNRNGLLARAKVKNVVMLLYLIIEPYQTMIRNLANSFIGMICNSEGKSYYC